MCLGEPAFDINMKRSCGLVKKGLTCNGQSAHSKSRDNHYLGAISAIELIKGSLQLPQLITNKKRKRDDDIVCMSKRTVRRYYISFLKTAKDKVDQYSHTKDQHSVMDNASMHASQSS